MDRSRLLTVPLDTLTLSSRALALIEARERGRSCAELASSREELEDAPAELYLTCVIGPANEQGVLDDEGHRAWLALRTDLTRLLQDPRVQAFFFGWHERATELLAEIAGADSPDGAGEFRAKWFLDSLDGFGPEKGAKPEA